MRSRTTALGAGVGLGFLLLLLLDAVAARAGLAAGFVPRWESTAPWLTSRAAGATAFLALTLDVVFGLFVSTRAADRLVPRARSIEVHRWLSSVALALTALHALALLGDRFVRFDLLDVMVPFVAPYRVVAVGLGVLAGYALLIVHGSFRFRRELGAEGWRKLHSLSFGAFAAALVHGLFAGSDTHRPGMQLLYVSAAVAVGALFLRRRRGRGAAAA